MERIKKRTEGWAKLWCTSDYPSVYCDCSSTSTARQSFLGKMGVGNQITLTYAIQDRTRHQRAYDDSLTRPAGRITSERHCPNHLVAPQSGIFSSHCVNTHYHRLMSRTFSRNASKEDNMRTFAASIAEQKRARSGTQERRSVRQWRS